MRISPISGRFQNESIVIPIEDLKWFSDGLSELWWRVPIGLAFTISFPLLFESAFNKTNECYISTKRHKAHPAQQHPEVVGPFPIRPFRILFACCCLRFCWICNFNLPSAASIISHAEAFAWLAYVFFLLPLWLWHEKELLCLRWHCESNTGDALPKATPLLQKVRTLK